VNDAIIAAYETLQDTVPAQWLPRLDDVHVLDDSMAGRLERYGCGAYGCVFRTLDPAVVMKVTADDTEAEFAASLSKTLVSPICVHYVTVIRTAVRDPQDGSRVFFLWRESAEYVGQFETMVGAKATRLVKKQHEIAQLTYAAIVESTESQAERPSYDAPLADPVVRDTVRWIVDRWLRACQEMAQVDELQFLAQGLIDVYQQQRIFFGDLHPGNLGLVARPDGERWVITDPGHIAVLDL
jgi:hypothetical protein